MSCTDPVGALVVSCLVDPATRPTPAEAARILEPYQFVYVEPAPPMGPTVIIVGSSPTEGPFGPFPAFPPARRLDGSLLSVPPWNVTTYARLSVPLRPSVSLRPSTRAGWQARQADRPPSGRSSSSWCPGERQAPQGRGAIPRGTGWHLRLFRSDGSPIIPK